MREQVDPKACRYWYDSLREIGQYTDNEPKRWTYNESSNEPASTSWDLNCGYKQAVSMAKLGWLEGAQRAQDALKSFTPMTPAPETKTDFYGHMAHMPRFCAGAPDHMIRHARPPREGFGKVLTLVVSCSANCTQNAEYMANYGLGIAQYVNQLETDRVRVEVIGVMTEIIHERRVSHAWRIKGADQPLDLAVLAFCIGHPAMFRRIGFALIERCHAKQSPGYGRAVDAKLADVLNCPPNAFVLNGIANANSVAKTPQAALEHIETKIDEAIKQQELVR